MTKRICSILNCYSTDPLHSDRSFFKFPKEQELKEKWLRSIGEISDIKKNILVCDRHFKPNAVGLKKLKKNAYPTLFLRLELNAISEANINSVEVNEFPNGEDIQEIKETVILQEIRTQTPPISTAEIDSDIDVKSLSPLIIEVKEEPNAESDSDIDVESLSPLIIEVKEEPECETCCKMAEQISVYKRLLEEKQNIIEDLTNKIKKHIKARKRSCYLRYRNRNNRKLKKIKRQEARNSEAKNN